MTSNTMRTLMKQVATRMFAATPLALLCAASVVMSSCAAAPETGSRAFGTPEQAAQALIDITNAGNVQELQTLFGPDSQEIIDSSDPATGSKNREVFLAAIAEGWELVDADAGRKSLVIGNERWPFPVPLAKDGDRWRFDTAAGTEEILARRIGQNELALIQIGRSYVGAQRRYAEQGHDGKPAGLYARTFWSEAGKQNGLYWPDTQGQKRSPMGDLVAQAANEGRPLRTDGTEQPVPFHGYYFKILSAQGAAATGGAKPYVVNGDMSGGFGLVAWPAQYNRTGIMTFIVNQDGVLFQKDLGPETATAATAMTLYDPDGSWSRVP